MDVSSSCCGFRGCFRFFGSAYRKRDDNVYEHLVQQEGRGRNKETTWWRKKLNEAKEYTEAVGGPKWKNFIRNIEECRFPYDIHSYALNFDEGVGREGADAVLGFTARFAAPFSNEHGSMGGPVHGTDESAFVKSRG
ncbi:hypothetical protein D8674_014721 [Pyrus ussuriensis x Pyrus communis]|uniref:Uncharacterized protein n=1 Tax=Pyrus ussuriensis x Pyrus communis TaxID=2448454 RepID=A0A5N5GYK0_9ROSA|nr:hypothetical protein D8674_014721 [Pyrus ussuriensis x Pyrus communis]